MAKIEINKLSDNEIEFSWKTENNEKREIVLYIKESNENVNTKNTFDDLFDFIIDKLEKGENIDLPNEDDFKKNDTIINSIILAILEPLKDEIKKIQDEIKKLKINEQN